MKLFSYLKRNRNRLLIGILIGVVVWFLVSSRKPQPLNTALGIPVVEIAPAGGLQALGDIVVDGQVIAGTSVDLRAEASGQVRSIAVDVEQAVANNQRLVSIDASNQNIAVQQAEANLAQQESILRELLDNQAGASGSSFADLKKQQDQLVENALQTLLNTDITAYVADPTKTNTGPAPIISGTYTGPATTYNLETYPSSSKTGASLRVTGAINQTITVSTDSPIALGSNGLFIQFIDGFDRSENWIVPIPNTRSSAYTAANNAYQAALATREATLSQSDADDFQIERQQNAVTNARLAVDAARTALGDTVVRAPFAGVITDVAVEQGAFVSAGQVVATIQNRDLLEIEVFVPRNYRNLLNVGQTALINNTYPATISSVASTTDRVAGKIKVTLTLNTETAQDILDGDRVTVSLAGASTDQAVDLDQIYVPLTAIQVIAGQTSVLVVDDKLTVAALPVTTGLLRGDSIEIIDGLTGATDIIIDGRQLRIGQTVKLAN